MEVLRRMLVLSLTCSLGPMLSVEMCDIIIDLEMERDECLAKLQNVTSGCSGKWDFACWPSASVGQLVTIPCPKYFTHVSDREGNISRLCTEEGWMSIDLTVSAQNCGYSLNVTEDFFHGEFLRSVMIGYTIGHSVSLASLVIAIFILCFFRKLHCTRNYIHIHLFLSFILKAIAVIMKDVALYKIDSEDCIPSSVGCKAAMVFFQYGVMASFFWLLVEGLYLHALLAVSFFSHRKYFWWYILIGWGVPAFFITTWSITKAYLHDVGCWDFIDNELWLIIKIPILLIILLNFILFVCIIRILRQKINCRDIGRNESNQYSRLAKSTLLLIPLFGINYIIFAFMPPHVQAYMRHVVDLILGSFQGFCVAILYCFLNGEVQSEIKRKWRRWHMQRFLGTKTKYHQPSLASNGSTSNTQITMLTKCSPTSHHVSSCMDEFSTI
ncbi:vasoactive intestinal polypeptide receptor isoform X2 [Tachysurus fulvidraco]|uniref:vasoactive intestinal polypeptide receptor isoform X2 n=1 Tax=Tachysurus fulvidraco TaxID=1234273 RepID=UPI000F4F27C4|nr:vasoactive intestinal polypeptide receptor isoform X2 [Tachysurus fulvidraco]